MGTHWGECVKRGGGGVMMRRREDVDRFTWMETYSTCMKFVQVDQYNFGNKT